MMMTLEELIQHRDNIDELCKHHLLDNFDLSTSLDVAVKMLSALIIQLDSQSISFTP